MRSPGGVAVNGSTGDVYVADTANNRVDEWSGEGTFIRAFGWGVLDGSAEAQVCETSCQAGLSGTGEGEMNEVVGVAVAASGDVYVVNRLDGRISVFSGEGAYLESFGSYGSEEGEFGFYLPAGNDIAIGAGGKVYVDDSGKSRVAVFGPTGEYESEISGTASSIGTDSSGSLYATGGSYPTVVRHYDSAGTLEGEFPLPEIEEYEYVEVHGVVVEPTSGDILVETSTGFGSAATFMLREFSPSGQPIGITPLSYLKAPSGSETATYGLALSGATTFPGFKTGAVYITDKGHDRVVMTAEIARPNLTGVATADIGTAYADLSGNVNPEGLPTTYIFEFGPTAAYGSTFPASPAALAPSLETVAVGAHLTGLTPGTTYHYRLVAENSEGRSVGSDHSFTTYPAGGPTGLPDGRAYEMVTPTEKGGNDAEPHGFLAAFGVAGEGESGLAYTTMNGLPGSESGLLLTGNVAKRGADGWTTSFASAPDLNQTTLATGVPVMLAGNLESALVASKVPLTPNAPNGNNLYVRRVGGTGFQLVTDREVPPAIVEALIEVTYSPTNAVGASKNFDHVFFQAEVPLTADSPQTSYGGKLYEWSGGNLRNVGILPGESSPTTAPIGAYPPSLRPVSEDGSQVLFNAEVGGASELFLRKNDAQTIEISKPEAGVSDPGGPQRATLVGAAADGSTIYFTSASKLTADAYTGESPGGGATDLEPNLYRYDVAGGKLTDLTVAPAAEELGANVKQGIVASSGQGVFFVAGGVLAPGAASGANNLYHWGQGEGISFVADLASTDALVGTSSNLEAGTDASGNAIAFTSTAGLTGPGAAAGVPEIYHYSVAEGLACASCGSGLIRTGARITVPGVMLGSGSGHPISADGSKVFFSTKDALVKVDTNNKEDAYEWEGGSDRLISSGTGNSDSYLVDASQSGKDVFFATRDRLVPADQDENIDIYDAREGGGFATAPVAAPCEAEACRPPLSAAPTAPRVASQGYAGPGNKKHKHKHKKHHKKHKAKPCKAKARQCKKQKSHKAHSGGKRG